MSIVTTVEQMITLGFKNGMSFAQVTARVPTLAAKQMRITVPQFHQQFDEESLETIDEMVKRITQQFTPEEQAAILARTGKDVSPASRRAN